MQHLKRQRRDDCIISFTVFSDENCITVILTELKRNHLQVFTLPLTAPDIRPLKHIATYLFPKTGPELIMVIQSRPSSTRRYGTRPAFDVSPAGCILVLKFAVITMTEPLPTYGKEWRVYIRVGPLLSHHSSPEHVTIPWAQWGPRSTRWFPVTTYTSHTDERDTIIPRQSYSNRVVHHSVHQNILHTLDFTRYRDWPFDDSTTPKTPTHNLTVRSVASEDLVPHTTRFIRKKVRCSLPYRETTMPAPETQRLLACDVDAGVLIFAEMEPVRWLLARSVLLYSWLPLRLQGPHGNLWYTNPWTTHLYDDDEVRLILFLEFRLISSLYIA